MRWGVLAALLLTTTSPAYSADIAIGGSTISLSGLIGPDDAEAFKVKAQALPGKATAILYGPGGNLLAAFAIGEFIRLRGWSTYVSDECDSACALIWLGGVQRLMTPNAKIGFHAASLDGQETGLGNVVLGAYLNRIGLGREAVTYATQAGPINITYLTPNEAKRVGIEVSVVSSEGAEHVMPSKVVAQQTSAAILSAGRLKAESEASFLVRYLFGNTSNNAQTLASVYWASIMYYGAMTPVVNVLADKQRFFTMWPTRSYTIRSMTPAKCVGDNGIIVECQLSGIVDWEANSPTKKSLGSTTFEYTLKPWPLGTWSAHEGGQVGLRITSESGKPLSHQIIEATTKVPARLAK
jgi:hypothetical protein